MKLISVEEFKKVLQQQKDDTTVAFINVCTTKEYMAASIDGVQSMPLDELESHVKDLADKQTIYIHCTSGVRTKLAADTLTQLGVNAELIGIEGGLIAWMDAGFKTVAGKMKMSFFQRLFTKKKE